MSLYNLSSNDEGVIKPVENKLYYRVCEFIDQLNQNFGEKYGMGYQMSIDESLVQRKGRPS